MGNAEKKGWKEKLVSEFTEYWINVAYLALVFAAFTQYRRIILAIHDVTYTNYWVSLIEALILAKVIMIGDVVGLGRGLEHKPLIYPTLYKTVVFCALIAVFRVVEHILRELWQGERNIGNILALSESGIHEVLAYSMIVFVALIPFFTVREIGRVFGGDNLRALFFRRRSTKKLSAEG